MNDEKVAPQTPRSQTRSTRVHRLTVQGSQAEICSPMYENSAAISCRCPRKHFLDFTCVGSTLPASSDGGQPQLSQTVQLGGDRSTWGAGVLA